jgi:tetratricopeptide (TPR) repeat protein
MENFDALWNYSDPSGTEAKFRELLSSLGSKSDLYWQLKTQIARTEGLQRKFTEAHATLDEVQKHLDGLSAVTKVRYLLERGRVFNSLKLPEPSIFKEAFELALEIKEDAYAIDAAHMMAIANKDLVVQTYWNTKALKIAEASTNSKAKAWLPSLYNNMAWTDHSAGNFDNALELFKKSLALHEEKNNLYAIHVAKWSIARTLRSLKSFKEALKIQISLESSDKVDGYVLEEIAELYLALKDLERSKKYFALAYNELSKDPWFINNETDRLKRIKEMAMAQKV